jgi:hypothetical protein
MSARPNASCARHTVLANRAGSIYDIDVLVSRRTNLLLGGRDNYRVKKVPAHVHLPQGNVQDHVGDSIGFIHVLTKKRNHSPGVAKVGGNQMTATGTIKKADRAIKGSLYLKKFMDNVQDIDFGF